MQQLKSREIKSPTLQFALLRFEKKEIRWPAAALFMGTSLDILRQADRWSDFTTAKIKIGDLLVEEAIYVVKKLKNRFRLRLDINGKWSPSQVSAFCFHFEPSDFDFIEDPSSSLADFKMASDELSYPNSMTVWKPSVKGIPRYMENLILSSSWETGVGISNIVRLADYLNLAKIPLGIGTYLHKPDKTSLIMKNGEIIIPEVVSYVDYR
jgi:O-succinylbenzoate synthase